MAEVDRKILEFLMKYVFFILGSIVICNPFYCLRYSELLNVCV